MTVYRQRLHSATNDTHVISCAPNFSIPLSSTVGVTIDSNHRQYTATGNFTGFKGPNIAMVLHDLNNVT